MDEEHIMMLLALNDVAGGNFGVEIPISELTNYYLENYNELKKRVRNGFNEKKEK